MTLSMRIIYDQSKARGLRRNSKIQSLSNSYSCLLCLHLFYIFRLHIELCVCVCVCVCACVVCVTMCVHVCYCVLGQECHELRITSVTVLQEWLPSRSGRMLKSMADLTWEERSNKIKISHSKNLKTFDS